MLSENVSQALEEVVKNNSKMLKRIAGRAADYVSGYDPEDAFSDALLALAEQSERQPAFLDQKPAYITSLASWRARAQSNSQRTYRKYLEPEDERFEMAEDPKQDPLQQVEDNEQGEAIDRAVKALSPRNQEIVALLFCGFSQKQIADRFQISEPAISLKMRAIRTTFQQFIGA